MNRFALCVATAVLATGLLAGCGGEPAPTPTVDINALLGGAAVVPEEGALETLDEWVDPLRLPQVEEPVSTVEIPPTLTRTPVLPQLVKLRPLESGVILDGVGGSTRLMVEFVFDSGDRVRVDDPVGKRVTFSSANPEVASVDESGTVFGRSMGRTEVRVVSAEGPSAVVSVEIRGVLPTLAPVEVLTTADILVAEQGLDPLPPVNIDRMVFIGETDSGLVVNRLIVRFAEGASVSAVAEDHRLQVLAELADGVVVAGLPVSDLAGMQTKVVELSGDSRIRDTHPVMVVGLRR